MRSEMGQIRQQQQWKGGDEEVSLDMLQQALLRAPVEQQQQGSGSIKHSLLLSGQGAHHVPQERKRVEMTQDVSVGMIHNILAKLPPDGSTSPRMTGNGMHQMEATSRNEVAETLGSMVAVAAARNMPGSYVEQPLALGSPGGKRRAAAIACMKAVAKVAQDEDFEEHSDHDDESAGSGGRRNLRRKRPRLATCPSSSSTTDDMNGFGDDAQSMLGTQTSPTLSTASANMNYGSGLDHDLGGKSSCDHNMNISSSNNNENHEDSDERVRARKYPANKEFEIGLPRPLLDCCADGGGDLNAIQMQKLKDATEMLQSMEMHVLEPLSLYTKKQLFETMASIAEVWKNSGKAAWKKRINKIRCNAKSRKPPRNVLDQKELEEIEELKLKIREREEWERKEREKIYKGKGKKSDAVDYTPYEPPPLYIENVNERQRRLKKES